MSASPESHLPRYDELPAAPHGGRLGWGVFGDDDELGLINLLTPEVAVTAAKLARRGASFPLDLPFGTFDPPLNPHRQVPRHRLIEQATIGFDDAWDDIYPQSGSQWDSLAHVGYDRETYYNGATAADVRSGRNAIDNWSRHGIATRGLVLDLEQLMRERDASYSPASPVRFGVAELEEARSRAGVELRTGDILLLHTGFPSWYLALSSAERAELPGHVVSAGLEPGEDIARYLWDHHVAGVAADNYSVEVWPADMSPAAEPFGFVHQMLIGSFGMALGELWWLEDLVQDCRRDGVFEGFLVSTPLNAPGGIGSTANAVLIK